MSDKIQQFLPSSYNFIRTQPILMHWTKYKCFVSGVHTCIKKLCAKYTNPTHDTTIQICTLAIADAKWCASVDNHIMAVFTRVATSRTTFASQIHKIGHCWGGGRIISYFESIWLIFRSMEWTDVNILVAPCKTTYESKDKVQMGKKIERINKDMQLILYSPDIWMLHTEGRYIAGYSHVTPRYLENIESTAYLC